MLERRRVVRSFREIEIELVEGNRQAIGEIERALRRAGARDDEEQPKLFRALGLERHAPTAVPRRAPALAHLDATVRAQRAALLRHDPGTRLGDDPEELHQLRVATRRLRAFLRAARPLLDPVWADGIRDELGWLGREVGPVRDLDVLIEHLSESAAELGEPDADAAAPLLERLAALREAARAELIAALESDRYLRLLASLDESVHRGSNAPHETLEHLAAGEHRRLRRAMRALGPDAADAELHAARIRVKRARYAAELAQPVVGKPAARVVRAARDLQDVLGAHQDSVVARELLKELGPDSFQFGVLWARQEQVGKDTYRELPVVVEASRKKKLRKWLG